MQWKVVARPKKSAYRWTISRLPCPRMNVLKCLIEAFSSDFSSLAGLPHCVVARKREGELRKGGSAQKIDSCCLAVATNMIADLLHSNTRELAHFPNWLLIWRSLEKLFFFLSRAGVVCCGAWESKSKQQNKAVSLQ